MTGAEVREGPTVKVRSGAATDPGRRPDNQDAYWARAPLFLVADGMGGHASGASAALAVSRAFAAVATGAWLVPADLVAATEAAIEAVGGLGTDTGARPGSTVSGVGVATFEGGPAWLVFNIGDSRTYLVRDGVLDQVTVDHSRVQELLDTGVSEVEARGRVSGNVITRAIGGGMRSAPQLDQWLVPARAGDRLLICSDGITGELSDALIAATMLAHADPRGAATALVEAAVSAGGRDNATAVVVDAISIEGAVAAPAITTEVDTLSDGAGIDDEPTRPDASIGEAVTAARGVAQ